MDKKFFQSEKFNDMQNDEIYGYLESSDDLLIRGEVNGDVFCRGTVYCSGTITGNIRANQVQLYHSHVAGDITCRKIYTDDVSDVQGYIMRKADRCAAASVEKSRSLEPLLYHSIRNDHAIFI